MSCNPTMIYKTGIYKIQNLITNQIYIGSASRISKYKSCCGFFVRFQKHKSSLIVNTHYNIKLQRALNKYGSLNFNFEILATCPPEYCIKLEQWFIDNLKPFYNIRTIADSNLGVKKSEEHKQKISIGIKKAFSEMTDFSFRERSAATQRITKKGMKRPYDKRTEQGLVNNRIKRRSHSNIAKLDSEKVKDIKIMLKNKETMKTCANKYNVHIGTIQAIKSGLTWFDIKID